MTIITAVSISLAYTIWYNGDEHYDSILSETQNSSTTNPNFKIVLIQQM